ncbi:uncharacterized protein G2W53_018029 [Senna tora]|uniref:Uncharacterized protein n=1 Tax=Senna tora TaxID=362788 RepID=A0A834WKP8_9FABA|nr:uncharacterized protein G2W53_018029 [Senna tora]
MAQGARLTSTLLGLVSIRIQDEYNSNRDNDF